MLYCGQADQRDPAGVQHCPRLFSGDITPRKHST